MDNNEISEALSRAMDIADDVVPEREHFQLGPDDDDILADVTYTRAKTKHPDQHPVYSEQAQAMLDACRTTEPVSDEGYESYAAWATRSGWPGAGHGAGFMVKVWRANRIKIS